MSQVIRTRVVESGGAVETSTERVRIIEGISPTVDLQRVEDGVEITVHDVRGEQSAEVMDGADGVSPTVTVTDITGGHRVTVTDATGTSVFDVMDGDSSGGTVWQSIELSVNDWDSELGLFVVDVGEGNEIDEARFYGQVVYDEAFRNYMIVAGIGYSGSGGIFSTTYQLTHSSDLYRIAVAGNFCVFTTHMYNNYVTTQKAPYGQMYYGVRNTSQHGVDVDAIASISASNRAGNAYWNNNNPRYMYIKMSPTNPSWAYILVEYKLKR